MTQLFSHLRVSSEFSISQGLLTVDQIVDNAVRYSVPSVALTDKSNMFGLVKFFNKCESAGIKPISGSSIRLIFDDDDFGNACDATGSLPFRWSDRGVTFIYGDSGGNGPLTRNQGDSSYPDDSTYDLVIDATGGCRGRSDCTSHSLSGVVAPADSQANSAGSGSTVDPSGLFQGLPPRPFTAAARTPDRLRAHIARGASAPAMSLGRRSEKARMTATRGIGM